MVKVYNNKALRGVAQFGSIEFERVLRTMKRERNGAAVKISVSHQDTKKFGDPQESHLLREPTKARVAGITINIQFNIEA